MTSPVPVHLQEFFYHDAVAQYLGVELLALGVGYAKIRMPIEARHLNLFGTVHGGIIFTLADIAFGLAGNADGIPSVAIDAVISYMKSARGGTLTAEAKECTTGNRIATYRVVVSGSEGEGVAVFQGMAYRKPYRKFPPSDEPPKGTL